MSYDLDKLARDLCGCSWCASGLDMCREHERREEMLVKAVAFRDAVQTETAKACAKLAENQSDVGLDCPCGAIIIEKIEELFPGVEDG